MVLNPCVSSEIFYDSEKEFAEGFTVESFCTLYEIFHNFININNKTPVIVIILRTLIKFDVTIKVYVEVTRYLLQIIAQQSVVYLNIKL